MTKYSPIFIIQEQISINMKLPIRYLLSALLFILNLNNIDAQTKIESLAKHDSIERKSSYFILNTNYLSNAVYSGRKDSSIVPYIRSSISYYHKSGFYADLGASLLVSPEDVKRIDLITFGAGYAFKISDKLDVDINATKFNYTDLSYAAGSELKGITGINLGYDAGIVSISGGAELLYSTNTDIFSSLKIARSFEIGSDNNKFTFAPSIQANAGTQYYNQAYYSNRKYSFTTTNSNGSGTTTTTRKGHAKKGTTTTSTGGTGTTTTTIKSINFIDKNKFALLDYEISAPITYEYKNFVLFATPTFAIPVNATTYQIDGALTEEKISNTFFFEIGATIKFPTRHKKP